MPLGGYKFAGRYCQKGSLTDQQWAKRMQETKVAAFMAANALANAGWEYDMEGSPDGNIHCLDTVGNNYCTCFKNTAAGHYFCLLTLTNYAQSSSTAGVLVFTNGSLYRSSATSTHYLAGRDTAFARYSTSTPFSYANPVGAFSDGQTNLFPVANPGYQSQSWSSSSNKLSPGVTFFALTENYYGFAIKGNSIILFSGGTPAGCAVSVISGSAYSTLLSSETSSWILLNFQAVGTGTSTPGIYDEISTANTNKRGGVICTASGQGNSEYDSLCRFFAPPIACYSGNTLSYPFQSIYATTYLVDPVTRLAARGILSIDLISANFQPTSQAPARFSPVANGNYLTVSTFESGIPEGGQQLAISNAVPQGFSSTIPITWYVGWDPSNPDITQSSAWTLYSGE